MLHDDPLSLLGQVLDGTYRIDSLVGEGGFGVVYKAYHLGFEQPIAVKALKIPGDFAHETREGFLRKFREEGKLLFQLSQGTLGIVRSIAIGDTVTPSGVWAPFVVLEWLDGQPLSEVLGERRRQGFSGRPLGEVIEWLDTPAKALAYAHSHRVAHRDIKPANLFVMKSGAGPQLKLLDFGIAKVMEEGAQASGTAKTNAGFTSFTPQYAAPEQFDPSMGRTGPWSDVYSFALVAVEMLTDRAAVEGDNAFSLVTATMNRELRPTPRARGSAVPDSVERVFSRALAVDATVRFPDIAAFWEALKLVGKSEAKPPTAPTKVSRRTQVIPTPPPGALVAPANGSVAPSRAPALPVVTPPQPPHGGQYEYGPAPHLMVPPSAAPWQPPPSSHTEVSESKTSPWVWILLGVVICIAVIMVVSGMTCVSCMGCCAAA